MTFDTMSVAFILLLASLAGGFPQNDAKSVAPLDSKVTFDGKTNARLNSGSLLNDDKKLSTIQSTEGGNEDNGLIEVKENEIPEGSVVYVLEEPESQETEGEILKTASNIVFRPLFRYRSKQEAQRRNSNRFRRRYFIPRRSYRHVYYPYYYRYRYY